MSYYLTFVKLSQTLVRLHTCKESTITTNNHSIYRCHMTSLSKLLTGGTVSRSLIKLRLEVVHQCIMDSKLANMYVEDHWGMTVLSNFIHFFKQKLFWSTKCPSNFTTYVCDSNLNIRYKSENGKTNN